MYDFRSALSALDMTQREAATLLGVSERQVRRYAANPESTP